MEDIFVCFTTKQSEFVMWLIEKKLIKPIACAYIEHPLTRITVIQIQKYKTNHILNLCFRFVFSWISGEESVKKMLLMEKIDVVQKVNI